MCIATIAAVASTVVSATGSIAGGIAKGRAYDYQAQVARNNATIAQQNAARAASAGAAQTEQVGMKERARQASLRAAMAANGVDVNSGSASDVQAGQRQIGSLDAATVANNAALEAYGYQSQSTNYTAQAGLDAQEAKFAPIEGALKGAGSLFSSAGNIFQPSGGGSQLSGDPTVPEEFSWMQSPGGGIDTGA